MKLKTVYSFIVATLACFLTTQHIQAQGSLQVVQITLAGSLATTVSMSSNHDAVVTGKFTTETIINIARGRVTTNAVPSNEKLALALRFTGSGAPQSQLVVCDAIAHSNIVVIADLNAGGAVDTIKGKGTVGMAGEISSAGNFTNGWIALTGKATLNFAGATPSFTSLSSAVQGIFRGNDFDVIVTKGKCTMVGTIWSEAGTPTTYYYDADNDGYGVTGNTITASAPSGYYRALVGGDCNDSDSSIHPGATELYDGLDNDCDGMTDEGFTMYYRDADSDGYGVTSDHIWATAPTGLYTALVGGDCNDGDSNVHPGAPEIPGNMIDDDCDGQTDEVNSEIDSDGDGIPDAYDNCPFTYNPDQKDTNADGIGDACD